MGDRYKRKEYRLKVPRNNLTFFALFLSSHRATHLFELFAVKNKMFNFLAHALAFVITSTCNKNMYKTSFL